MPCLCTGRVVWLSLESREKAFPPHALSRWDRVASHTTMSQIVLLSIVLESIMMLLRYVVCLVSWTCFFDSFHVSDLNDDSMNINLPSLSSQSSSPWRHALVMTGQEIPLLVMPQFRVVWLESGGGTCCFKVCPSTISSTAVRIWSCPMDYSRG